MEQKYKLNLTDEQIKDQNLNIDKEIEEKYNIDWCNGTIDISKEKLPEILSNYGKDYYMSKKDVVLLEMNSSVLKEFVKHSINKKTFKFMEYSSFSRISATKYFNKILKKTKSPNNQFWQIVYKNNFAGTIALLNLKNKSVELRYAISHNFWNKGIFQICNSFCRIYRRK